MSSAGGIGVNQNSGAQNLPPSQGAGKAGQTQSAEHVGRGFASNNSVSHQRSPRSFGAAPSGEKAVRLPKPTVDLARLPNLPGLQAQINQSKDTTELAFTFNDILSELATASEENESSDSDISATGLFGSTKQKRGGQQSGGNSGGGSENQKNSDWDQTIGKLAEGQKPQTLLKLQNEALKVFDTVLAIESAPPEVMQSLKASSAELADAVLLGNVEDVARILAEVQTKLQDTRIKFDEQAIRTSRLKRTQLFEQRIGKLTEALEKMKEAGKAGILGKIFGAIATVLMVIVAAVTIATGVGAKAGVMLIMAATIMVAMTVSQNSGDWMTNLGGLIKDEKLQLVLGLAWAITAAALSLGAGFVGGSGKVATDAATTTVQQATNAATQAAQQGANTAAQGVQQTANATAQGAQQAAQQTSSVVQETAKAAAKTATDVADDAANQATKVAVKSAEQATKETVKSTAEATKETAKEATKQLAEISKKELYFRRASHIGRFTQGASQAVEGSAQISATVSRYDGEIYQADAQDRLAEMTKIDLQMDDLRELITNSFEARDDGPKVVSDIIAQILQSKANITRNI